MKVRDSGMPDEAMWNSFFDPEKILDELGVGDEIENIAEIGCGYGTFTLPASKKIRGILFAIDFEKEMTDLVRSKAVKENIPNIVTVNRDVLSDTTGLEDSSSDFVFLFNILHNEYPGDFLKEAYRILKPGGKAGIIHWRSDIITPRGPDLCIRPKPEDIVKMVENYNNKEKQGFRLFKGPFNIEPYHYGVVIKKVR